MVRILMWALLAYIGYRIVSSFSSNTLKTSNKKGSGRPDASPTHLDPVCGMYVSEEDAVIGKLNGERHYFCSRKCLDKFQEKLEQT